MDRNINQKIAVLLEQRKGLLSTNRPEYFRISSKIQRLRDPAGCRYAVKQWKLRNAL